MNNAFTFDGGEAAARAFEMAPAIMAEEMARWATEGTFFLQREIVERTPLGVGAGGGLAGSIQSEPAQVLADAVIGVVATSIGHAIPVELGSRPHFPPPAALEAWVAEKVALRAPDEIKSAALAVARKIAKHGTKGAFMFRDGLAAATPELERQATLAAERALTRIEGTA
ncbi:MAG: hypothetical protein GC150_15365 [Rhizobiales bacterium]|nr:hypothetical protein [Hyphomicrobiales bacterium]